MSSRAEAITENPKIKLMPTCHTCGHPIQFRVVDGVTRPMGCLCDSERDFYFERGENAKPSYCPYCNGEVFFVEHNGGCVWLDSLGPPWPEHGCFLNSGKETTNSTHQKTEMFAGRYVEAKGTITRILTSDSGHPFLRVSLPTRVVEFLMPWEFWDSSNRPRVHEEVALTIDGKKLIRKEGTEYSCKEVDLKYCNRCQELFLSWHRHKEICKSLF